MSCNVFAMPLFKRSDTKKKSRRKSSDTTPPSTLPPPPQEKAPQVPQTASQNAVTRQDLIFHAQLAHGSPTKKIKDFSNVKEMYARIGEAFKMRASEVSVAEQHVVGGEKAGRAEQSLVLCSAWSLVVECI